MRLLITGGAGFIGCNLARLALSHGHTVRIIDDLSTGHAQNIAGLDVEMLKASILDRDALQRAMQGMESVIHLAALGSVPRSIANPVQTHAVNATGTLAVLDSARDAGVNHVVSASSSSVYGLNPELPKSERQWVRPLSPYAVSKLAAEQYTLAYQQSYGLDTLAFRFFNVFGPWQRAGHPYAAVIPVFLDCLLRGKPLPINGDGSNSRDFTFVGTVTKVLLQAAERRVSHAEPVNLAFGTNTSLLQLTEELARISGIQPELQFREPRPGDVKHSRADNESLLRLFPHIRPVSLTDGLKQGLSWFQEQMR